MSEIDELREAFGKIADVFNALSKKLGPGGLKESGYRRPADVPGCSIKPLPKRLLIKAAAHAIRINPVNAPMAAPIGGDSGLGVMDPMQIAVS